LGAGAVGPGPTPPNPQPPIPNPQSPIKNIFSIKLLTFLILIIKNDFKILFFLVRYF